MKTYSPYKSLLKSAAVAALLGLASVLHASEKLVVAKKVGDVVIPKSSFADNAQSGKDPFFPNSTRRLAVIARVVPTTNTTPTVSSFSLLTLKGISGTKAQPLALINYYTVAQGEAAEIRCGLQTVKIRCLEIRESSVLLQLADSKEIREIKLREGI